MTNFAFSGLSISNLKTAHPLLQKLFMEALPTSPYDFSITEGLRTVERQKYLFDAGKSKTMNSRHLSGKAIDIAVFVNGKLTWDFDKYKEVAAHVKAVAASLQIPIVWGGDWVSFKDGPHFELDRKSYP